MAATITIQVNQQASGNAVQTVVNDLRTLDNTARTAGGGFSTLGATIASTMGGLAAGAIAGAGQAMVGFAADSISAAGDFEGAVNNLAAISGTALADAGFSFADVSAKALQLGQDTAYSASESIAAMTELVKGGVPVVDVMGDATDATLNLAAAGGVELASAAEIVAKQLGVWGETGLTATEASDLLTQAANASTVGVEDLALGLANAGGTAKTAGVEYGDLVQSMALLAPNFSSASDAGTSFKTFLSRLIPTTDPAKAAMADLGLYTAEAGSAFYDASGQFIGMEAAAGLLQEKTAGLSEEQRLLAFNTIFGADAIRAAAAIATAGATGFNDVGAAMAAAGTASETAAIQNQGFNFALDSLKGSLETLQIVIGGPIKDALTVLMNDVLIPAIGQITAFATALISSGDPLVTLGAMIMGLPPQFDPFVAILQAIIPMAIQFGSVIASNWQPILAAIGAIIAAVVVPALASFVVAIAPVVAAVMAAIAIGAALYGAWTSNFMGIQGLVAAAMAAVQSVITSVMGVVLSFWEQNGADIMAFAEQTWKTVQEIVGTIVAIVAEIVTKVFTAVADFINEHGAEIQTILETAWKSIENTVNLTMGVIQGIVNTILAVIQGDWEKAGEGINQIVDSIKTYVVEQFNNLKGLITALGPGFISAAKEIGQAIIDGIVGALSSGASAIADAAKDAAQSALDAAKSLLGIKSPSAVFAAQVGLPIVQGMAQGMIEAAPMAAGAAGYAANAALGGASSTVNRSFTYAPTIYSSGGADAVDVTTARAMAGI